MKSHDMGDAGTWAELDDVPGVRWLFKAVGGRFRAVGVAVLNDEGVTEADLRAVPVRRVEANIVHHAGDQPLGIVSVFDVPQAADVTAEVGAPTKRELRVTVPKTRRFPDSFYEKVATLYWRCVAGGVAPTPAIASANDVPRTTVRAWFTEARARGLLAPARKQGSTG